MPAPPAPKTGYAAGAALRPFFTGAAARLSPDGSCLAATCGEEAHVVDSRGGGLLAVLEGDSEPLTALAFGCERLASRAVAASRLAGWTA